MTETSSNQIPCATTIGGAPNNGSDSYLLFFVVLRSDAVDVFDFHVRRNLLR
jgi:hypothetical protein